MTCYEFIFDKKLDEEKYIEDLADIYDLSPETILFVNEVDEDFDMENVKLLCTLSVLEGDYSALLSIYIRDPVLSNISEKKLAIKLCERNKESVLISDDSCNPYTMLLISERGDISQVSLDPDALDEERYVVASDLD